MRRMLSALAVALVATPALAFDCQKAATPPEKAICADPTARAADDAMAAAFSARLEAENPSAKPTQIAAQAAWLRDRDRTCADAKAPGACLAEQSARRRAFLAAEPEAGPGAPGRLAPALRIEKGAKGKAAISLQLLKYPAPATPAERAFNAAVDKLVGALDEPEKDDPAPGGYDYERAMRLVYASPQLISAHMDGFNDTGGAHPSTFSGDINIDVAQGRELRFADLVDAKGAKAIDAYCLKAVAAEKRARLGADAPRGAGELAELSAQVVAATGSLTSWSFAAEQATIGYDPYAVGAYVEGAYACEIPYAVLRPLAKPSFPLP